MRESADRGGRGGRDEKREAYDRRRDHGEDQQRPVDLGRTARPYPEDRGHREGSNR